MSSCNSPRQNLMTRTGQGSNRNMPQRPMGCEQRMRERESCEQRVPEREGCVPGMRERECCEQRVPEREKCRDEMQREKWPIGMTYVPMQKWGNLYPPEEGFCQGTIFKELDLPFTGRRMC